jgi:hypothetical protein
MRYLHAPLQVFFLYLPMPGGTFPLLQYIFPANSMALKTATAPRIAREKYPAAAVLHPYVGTASSKKARIATMGI